MCEFTEEELKEIIKNDIPDNIKADIIFGLLVQEGK